MSSWRRCSNWLVVRGGSDASFSKVMPTERRIITRIVPPLPSRAPSSCLPSPALALLPPTAPPRRAGRIGLCRRGGGGEDINICRNCSARQSPSNNRRRHDQPAAFLVGRRRGRGRACGRLPRPLRPSLRFPASNLHFSSARVVAESSNRANLG